MRIARALLLATLALAACGRSARDSQAPDEDGGGSDASTAGVPTSGNGGAAGGAAAGGASARGGGTNGGGPAGGASGAAPVAGQGGASVEITVGCWDWENVENEPVPGANGPDACPAFSDIVWVPELAALHRNCVFRVAQDEAVAPEPGGETGDCCYAISYHECR